MIYIFDAEHVYGCLEPLEGSLTYLNLRDAMRTIVRGDNATGFTSQGLFRDFSWEDTDLVMCTTEDSVFLYESVMTIEVQDEEKTGVLPGKFLLNVSLQLRCSLHHIAAVQFLSGKSFPDPRLELEQVH